MIPNDPVVIELLSLHEIFRRLGYPAEDLFVHMYTTGQVQFVLQQGDKQFTVNVSQNSDPQKLSFAWAEALEWWNSTGKSGDLDGVLSGSHAHQRGAEIAAALARKGFSPTNKQKI